MLFVVCSHEMKGKEKKKSKRREELSGLLNARVERVKGPELHVKRSRSHELDKERGIPQNPLIKGGILREFDVSDRVKEGREDGVDDLLQILSVDFEGSVKSRVEMREIPMHLIRSQTQSTVIERWFSSGKLHN